MTVAELIEELKRHGPDTLVFVSGECGNLELRPEWVAEAFWFLDRDGDRGALVCSKETLEQLGLKPQGKAVVL